MYLSIIDILVLLFCYLLGSIPFSVVIGRVFYGVDVRKQGSGNPGATNTLRVLGKKAGLIVLLLDMAKGVGAVFLGRLLSYHGELKHEEWQAIAGALAIAGHIFSPFLGFKGGKGVATATGVVLTLQPVIGLIIIIAFISILLILHYVSLGSITAAALYPVLNLIFPKYSSTGVLIFAFLLALVVIVKHKDNINRLMKGTENRFTLKSKPVNTNSQA